MGATPKQLRDGTGLPALNFSLFIGADQDVLKELEFLEQEIGQLEQETADLLRPH